jgi:hypothetical protein
MASLNDWKDYGWLRERETTPQEIWDLLQIARRNLKDAQCREVSADTRFSCAYQGVLKLAVILLFASGFEPERNQSHHLRVIDAIPLILGPEARLEARYLDLCRRHRNQIEYWNAQVATDKQADDLAGFALNFLQQVSGWLGEHGWLKQSP